MDQSIQALGVINVLINGYCFYYAYQTFNVKQCLNLIMCFDAALTSLASLLILISFWILTSDPFICSFVTFSILILGQLFCPYNFMCGYIRYKRVSTSMNSQAWKTESELIKIVMILIVTITILLILIIVINAVFEMEWMNYYTACMTLDSTVEPPLGTVGFILTAIGMVLIIGTFFVDIKTIWMIKRYNAAESTLDEAENRQIKSEVPMRTSFLSLLLIAGGILTNVLITTDQSPKQLLTKYMLGQLLINLVKSPFIVFLTVRVNATNARIDQEAERERKRQIEIQEAKQKRNERIEKRLALQIEEDRQKGIEMTELPKISTVQEVKRQIDIKDAKQRLRKRIENNMKLDNKVAPSNAPQGDSKVG